MSIKLMVDASIVSKGGGVQVALAFLENISQDSYFDVICVVSEVIDNQLDISIKSKFYFYHVENTVPMYRKFQQGKLIHLIEKEHKPDFVFILFGAAYWKPKAPSLQGFALGKMLYSDELQIGFYEKIINLLKKLLFKTSKSYLLVETTLVKRKLAKYLNYSEDKIFVIGNSYSPAFSKYININKGLLKPENNLFRILIPGSYYPHKNLERVLQAIEKIKNNVLNIRFLFTIPSDSEEWKVFQEYAKKNGVIELIETSGFIANSRFGELYLKSNAVLCASLVESSTAVFPEAFIAERPLLVSNRPYATELCENAALYFDPLDHTSIADAILKIYSDIKLREELVENGKMVLKKNYPSSDEKWIQQRNLILKLANR